MYDIVGVTTLKLAVQPILRWAMRWPCCKRSHLEVRIFSGMRKRPFQRPSQRPFRVLFTCFLPCCKKSLAGKRHTISEVYELLTHGRAGVAELSSCFFRLKLCIGFSSIYDITTYSDRLAVVFSNPQRRRSLLYFSQSKQFQFHHGQG